MKCQIPQISWHSRDPVLSVDFQPLRNDLYRLASGGTDSHVLIWYITYQDNKSVKIECASDLYRHNKSVNVVRFSPNGELLASGDDEGAIFIWQLKDRDQAELPKDDDNINKEEWYPVKLLRGHLEDIYDISWSKDGNFLVSASMDNTVFIWDIQKYVKVHIFSDFKGYVQGVTWDPCNQYIASIGSDRTLRIHNISSKKTVYKIIKAPWKMLTEKGNIKARLFYDDTLKSYFRRLSFTPDGEFLIVPSGIVEKGEKFHNTTYIFSKQAINKPVISLPTGDKYSVAVRCNPLLYKLRGTRNNTDKENELPKLMIDLPYRMIFAVAACDSVLMYDTEQLLPFAYISNIHYTHLTDLTWSPDGLTLVAASTDGYCSFIVFTQEEMGEIYVPEEAKEVNVPHDVVETLKSEKRDAYQSDDPPAPMKDQMSNTSTCTSPPDVKSPKAVLVSPDDNGDQGNTPSMKTVKIVAENKKSLKKSPKMISIKNFFIPSKPAVPVPSADEQNKATVESSMKGNVINDSTLCIGKVLHPETSDNELNNKNNGSSKIVVDNKKPVVLEAIKEEAMDIDEIPVIEKSDNLALSSCSSEIKTKCKVRLEFADEVEPVRHIDDNASDGDTSLQLLNDNTANNTELPKENEGDWTLELSQDEEIPMEVASSVPDKSNEVFKTKETPKRRIAFVTLSTKATSKK